MRKFKVVKKWPHGPAVGTVLSSSCEYSEYDLSNSECLEEVKEPVKGWMYGPCGIYEAEEGYGLVKHMAFCTKESAEKFAKALKDSHKLEEIEWEESNSGTFYIQEKGLQDGRAEIEDLIDALNDRVK